MLSEAKHDKTVPILVGNIHDRFNGGSRKSPARRNSPSKERNHGY